MHARGGGQGDVPITKIHRQMDNPALPSNLEKAQAKRPPKAEARPVEAKNAVNRFWVSWRLYHLIEKVNVVVHLT